MYVFKHACSMYICKDATENILDCRYQHCRLRLCVWCMIIYILDIDVDIYIYIYVRISIHIICIHGRMIYIYIYIYIICIYVKMPQKIFPSVVGVVGLLHIHISTYVYIANLSIT